MNRFSEGLVHLQTFVLAVLLSLCYSCGLLSSRQNIADNYKTRQSEIKELKHFFNSITPDDKIVHIEFDGNENIYHMFISDINSKSKKRSDPYFFDWNLDTKSDSLLKIIGTLGWNSKTLKEIKQNLDAAGCISITSGEPCEIGFQRRFQGAYSYLIFDAALTDSLKLNYTQSCAYRMLNDSTVLMYVSGATGSECYPAK